MKIYYFDYNATTPIAKEVFEEMKPFLTETYGNPSSIHRLGKNSLRAVSRAREQVAALIGASPREIIFTSGATESNNAAIQSVLAQYPGKKKIVTTVVEHSSVRNVIDQLEKQERVQAVRIPVDRHGKMDLSQFARELTDQVALVSIMWANNETGIIFPMKEIADLVKSHGILLHVDTVQAVGKIPIDLSKIGIDFLSLSAHKFYGPKGVGVLFVRDGLPFHPFIFGGHQERGRRGGTENVPGIIGMGKAAQWVKHHLNETASRLQKLREQLETILISKIPSSFVNGKTSDRICNTISLTIPNVSAEALIPRLDEIGICVSSGSACITGALEPSHVLQAMGLSRKLALSSIRLSLGCMTSEEEVNYVGEILPELVSQIQRVACPS